MTEPANLEVLRHRLRPFEENFIGSYAVVLKRCEQCSGYSSVSKVNGNRRKVRYQRIAKNKGGHRQDSNDECPSGPATRNQQKSSDSFFDRQGDRELSHEESGQGCVSELLYDSVRKNSEVRQTRHSMKENADAECEAQKEVG